MPRITAVSPGGRYVAIATLHGETMIRCEVLSLRSHESTADKLSAFSERLAKVIVEDQPEILVVEALRPNRKTEVAALEAERAGRVANSRGMELVHLELRRAAEIVLGDRRVLALIPWCAAQYPQTRSIVADPRAEYRRVRQLVAAVALGVAVARNLHPGDAQRDAAAEELQPDGVASSILPSDETSPTVPTHVHASRDTHPYGAAHEAGA